MAPRKRRGRPPISSPASSAASPSASTSPAASPSPPLSDTPPGESSASPDTLPESKDNGISVVQLQKWEERGRDILKKLNENGDEDGEKKGKGGKDVWCVGEVALAVVEDLVDWAVTEVCVEEHWARWKESGGDRLAALLERDELLEDDDDDVEDEKDEKEGDERKKATKNVNVVCSNCSGSIAAARYAQHLEKCLGRGGRSSSRAASARLKASAKRAEKEDLEQLQQTSRSVNGVRKRRAAALYPITAGDPKDNNGKRQRSQSPPPGLPHSGRGRFGTQG